MNLKSRDKSRQHLFVGLLCVIVLLAYNVFGRPLESVTQSNYNAWLQSVRSAFEEAKEGPAPQVRIRLFSTEISPSIELELDSSKPDTDPIEVLRILTLLEQTDVFGSRGFFDFNEANDPVHIEVLSNNQTFKTTRSKAELLERSSTQLLLKLLELYSNPSPNTKNANT